MRADKRQRVSDQRVSDQKASDQRVSDQRAGDPSSLLRDLTGLSLDEVIEGYAFKEKRGDLFVFSSGAHEIKLTLAAVRDELYQRVSSADSSALRATLKRFGVTRMNFSMPSEQGASDEVSYWVVGFDEERQRVTLRSIEGAKRVMHISHLYTLQGRLLLRSLRQLEDQLESSPFEQLLTRLDSICGEIFGSEHSAISASESLSSLLRIRIYLITRLRRDPSALESLRGDSLLKLREQLRYGSEIARSHLPQLVEEFKREERRVLKLSELRPKLRALEPLDEEDLSEVFNLSQLKRELYDAIRLTSRDVELSERLSAAIRSYQARIYEITSVSVTLTEPLASRLAMININDVADYIQALQREYLNSQLRVGCADLSLIRRFQIVIRPDRETYPILKSYEGVTHHERITLYRELCEHRLNLLFERGLSDPHLRSLALHNVHDFYTLFYKLTRHSSRII